MLECAIPAKMINLKRLPNHGTAVNHIIAGEVSALIVPGRTDFACSAVTNLRLWTRIFLGGATRTNVFNSWTVVERIRPYTNWHEKAIMALNRQASAIAQTKQ